MQLNIFSQFEELKKNHHLRKDFQFQFMNQKITMM